MTVYKCETTDYCRQVNNMIKKVRQMNVENINSFHNPALTNESVFGFK